MFRLESETPGVDASFQTERPIPVPMPWQAVFEQLEQYTGYATYRRTFDLDESWLEGEVLLDFGAVDYWCAVYVNDVCVGEHEGGYTPFRFAIRPYVHPGENSLRVRVYDSVQTEIVTPRVPTAPSRQSDQPPFDPTLIPHGKQTWYLDVSGIWQDVTIQAVPSRYVDAVHVTPNIHTGEARVVVMLGGAAQAGTLRASIQGQASGLVSLDVPADADRVDLVLRASEFKLWTPETAALYTVAVVLETDGEPDQVDARFGFREITTRDGKLLLNGEPIYLLCALDQDLYPDTIYTVPSEAFLRDEFAKSKALGLNTLRCHIKPPDPLYLDLADEMGLLIWSEIPSWRTFHPKHTAHESTIYLDPVVKKRAADLLRDMIARDFNHPSLIIWTIVNEDWGTALLLSESDRAWVAEMVDYCRQLDPTRLVVDNSPCPAPWGMSVHVKSDLDDFHIYTNIPDQAEQFEQFVEQFAHRPLWSFSNTGDAQRTGSEPIILSEFGNWGLPALARYAGTEPSWFKLGGWWSSWDGEPGYPTGAVRRFEQLGLNAIWPDYDAFAEASQWHQYYALKYEIETMRRLQSIQGYVITELTDIYWESNGLLDFARGEKVFHQRFARFNTPDLLIAQPNRYAFWDDDAVSLQLYASHYSGADWSDAVARVRAGGQDIFSTSLAQIARGEVREIGRAGWRLPSVERATSLAVTLDLEGGSVRAQNDVEVLTLPSSMRRAAFGGSVAVMMRPDKAAVVGELAPAMTSTDPMPEAEIAPSAETVQTTPALTPRSFAGRVQTLGYQVTPSITADTQVVVTDHPTAEMLNWVRSGGDMLYISNSSGSPFFWRAGRGGSYGGNWMTSFSWLKPEAHRRLQVANPVTLPFIDLMPLGVILGLPAADPAVQADFLAGQFTGWLRHPALHTVQFRFGRGRVIMTTYRLRESLTTHPLAAAMLNDLIDHLTSDACQPVLKANY
ncbi:MAG: hypothetical protein IPK19_20135 [Chloroflexi bacterium]|nr:hypothetical protein [Chloroflexota bacterium]